MVGLVIRRPRPHLQRAEGSPGRVALFGAGRPHRGAWGRRQLCVAALGALLTLAAPAVAAAHAFLVDSSPAAGARLAASPPQLVLRFTEQVVPVAGDRLTLRSASGGAVPLGPLIRSPGGASLSARLPRLAGGIYLVDWQVISAEDGHYTQGVFAFAVGAAGAMPSIRGGVGGPTDFPQAAATWLLLLGLAALGGSLAGEAWIWRPVARGRDWTPPAPPLAGPWAAALGGAAGLFVLFAGSLGGGGVLAGLEPSRWPVALRAGAGYLALATFLLVLYALLSASLVKSRRIALAALLAASVATSLRSHPAASHAWWGGPAIAVHVALGLLWAGVLGHLAWVLWCQRGRLPADLLAQALARYARLALWSVLLVLVSGLGAALAVFTSFGQLLGTAYGHVLLVKAALVAVALLLAGLGRAALGRARARDGAAAAALPRLRATTRLEAGALTAVLGVAALLGNVAPPSPVVSAAALLGPPPAQGPALTLAAQAGWLKVFLTASTGELTVRVITPESSRPQGVRLLNQDSRGDGFYLSPPGQARSIGLAPRPCGPGCFAVPVAWKAGVSRLRLDVAAKGWAGGPLSVDVPWPPEPRRPELLQRVIGVMQRQPSVVADEVVTSGPGASSHSTMRLSGARLMADEPYSAQVADVRALPGPPGQSQIVLFEPGSWLWAHLWLDGQGRIARQVILSQTNRVEDRFSYPGG